MVSYNVEGQVGDRYGVEWHSEIVNKKSGEAQALGKILVLNTTNNEYEIGGVGSRGLFAYVIKAAAAADARVEVITEEGVPVTKKVGTGVTLTPHCKVKLDASNNLAKFVDGTDDPEICVGQYNQHANEIADKLTALGDATQDEIVYIDLMVRPVTKPA